MPRSTPPSSRQLFFGLLAGVASLVAVQSFVWPRWPSVTPLDAEAIRQQLSAAGFEARPAAALPERRSFERATSEAPGFAIGKGETLRLLRGSTRDRFMLQAAFLAASSPSLSIKERGLFDGPPPYAQGSIKGSPVRQTCLVTDKGGNGGYGVTREQLLSLIDALPSGRWQKLEVVLGLRLPRQYECVLIHVEAGPAEPELDPQRWQRLLAAIRPAVANAASSD